MKVLKQIWDSEWLWKIMKPMLAFILVVALWMAWTLVKELIQPYKKGSLKQGDHDQYKWRKPEER